MHNPNTQVIGVGDLILNSMWDYGDLPESYATVGITGARHFVPANPNLFIGSVSADDEFSAFVSDTALGEDTNGVDEDGFATFPAIPVSFNSLYFDCSTHEQYRFGCTNRGLD